MSHQWALVFRLLRMQTMAGNCVWMNSNNALHNDSVKGCDPNSRHEMNRMHIFSENGISGQRCSFRLTAFWQFDSCIVCCCMCGVSSDSHTPTHTLTRQTSIQCSFIARLHQHRSSTLFIQQYHDNNKCEKMHFLSFFAYLTHVMRSRLCISSTPKEFRAIVQSPKQRISHNDLRLDSDYNKSKCEWNTFSCRCEWKSSAETNESIVFRVLINGCGIHSVRALFACSRISLIVRLGLRWFPSRDMAELRTDRSEMK